MVKFILSWLMKRNAYTNTFAELNALSDRDLNDLGISRGDIPTIAYNSMEKING